MLNLLYSPTLTSVHDYWKTTALTIWTFVGKVMSLLFNTLSKRRERQTTSVFLLENLMNSMKPCHSAAKLRCWNLCQEQVLQELEPEFGVHCIPIIHPLLRTPVKNLDASILPLLGLNYHSLDHFYYFPDTKPYNPSSLWKIQSPIFSSFFFKMR